MENNNNKAPLHPRDWQIVDLMMYLQYEMGWGINNIAKLPKEIMIFLVEKDEIDKE